MNCFSRHLAVLVIPAGILLFTGCRSNADDARSGQAEQTAIEGIAALTGFVIRPDNSDLVYQYFDGEGGLKVAQALDAIPGSARENVVVLNRAFEKGALPAGLIIMADLSAPEKDGSYPFRLVSRYVASTSSSTSSKTHSTPALQDEQAILFSTRWCPHCRTARAFLEQKGVPFLEKDVESDPRAQALLRELGKKQGIPENMLTSVPILYVGGKLVLGFNQREVERLIK
jgi:glutaredoxin